MARNKKTPERLTDEGMIWLHNEEVAEAIPMHYYGVKGQWFFPNGNNGYSRLKDGQAATMIAEHGFSRINKDEFGNSPCDRAQMWLIQNRSVAYAGLLAGYIAGLHDLNGAAVLVTESPKFIDPKNGSFNTIQKLIISLFKDDKHPQYGIFVQWLAQCYRSFPRRMTTDGPWVFEHCPILAMFGDSGCGKSALIKLVIEPLLGGKRADPLKFLNEGKFNKDLFSASLLCLDDKAAAANLEDRRMRVGSLKALLWDQDQRMEGKGQDALDITVQPFWRLVIAGNPGPGYNILPTLDKSLRDKTILLHCVQADGLPNTNEERAAWARRIQAELPAFAAFLLKFKADGKVDPRTGCVNFWHPMIANALMELQPEMRLLEMIDNLGLIDSESPLWEGTASEFEQAMRSLDKDDDGKKSGMMDRMFYNGQRAGAMLTELAEQTRRVIKTNHHGTSHYRIFRTEQK